MELQGPVGEKYVEGLFSGFLFKDLTTHEERLRSGLVVSRTSARNWSPRVHRVMCSVHQRAPLAWSSWRSDNRYWVEGCSKCGTNHIIPDVKAGAYLIGQNPEDGVLQLERAEALRKTKQQLLRDSTAAKSRAERVILKRYAEALQEERAVLVQKVRSELLCGLKGTKNSWMIEYL